MVTMEQLQAFMRKSAAEDANRKYVNVSGVTLEDALREASIELSLPIKRIAYEILEKGSAGVAGFGRKPVLIVAYPDSTTEMDTQDEDAFEMDFGFDVEESVNRDGKAIVRLTPAGVMLKVTPPEGTGEHVTQREAIEALSRRTTERFDTNLVTKIVKLADSEWIKVAEYEYNPANDAYITANIIEGEMRGTVMLSPPGPGGADPSADTIRSVLDSSGIVFGILDDALEGLENNPVYRETVTVAVGAKPEHGADARMAFDFKTDDKAVRINTGDDGRVDFKELNRIENVVEGQVLARKVPAQEGKPGQTVTGKLLPAKNGKDIDPPLGANTRLSDDQRSVIAEINGLVKLVAGKITVEPIYVVDGDVSMKTGNVRFLGTVIVKGNVSDGFSVTAAGDIEVMGSVSKSVLDAEGDIIVHQGITGKSDGKIRAGGSIWSKFIENTQVDAGDMIVVSDGIINSDVNSDKRIICRGKRASIVGGHIRAAEEVDAKTLGSIAGMETLIEVGYDPKSKERLQVIETKDAELAKQLEEIQLNMTTIENMRKNKQKISPEKLKAYTVMKTKREKIAKIRAKLGADRESIQAYLDELRTNGRVSASATVFPGVKVMIKDMSLPVRNEMRAVTFIADGAAVKVTKYEESRVDISVKRRGSGVDSTD